MNYQKELLQITLHAISNTRNALVKCQEFKWRLETEHNADDKKYFDQWFALALESHLQAEDLKSQLEPEYRTIADKFQKNKRN